MIEREHDGVALRLDPLTGQVVLGLGEEEQLPTDVVVMCPHGALELAREIEAVARRGLRLVPEHGHGPRNRAERRARRRR